MLKNFKFKIQIPAPCLQKIFLDDHITKPPCQSPGPAFRKIQAGLQSPILACSLIFETTELKLVFPRFGLFYFSCVFVV